jgi:hypothetical protein
MSHNRYQLQIESAKPIRDLTRTVKKAQKPVEILWKSCGKYVEISVPTLFLPSFFCGLDGCEKPPCAGRFSVDEDTELRHF